MVVSTMEDHQMNGIKIFLWLALSMSFLVSNVEAATRYKFDKRRGSPAEFDPGPPKNSRWTELYGSAPNYRLIGKEVLDGNREKFRWKWGPMWYRGRLNPQEVKVFVVGQEGAQDENVSNRAFTGSTGTKTQKLLNYMGIHTSYLFMNTFVYTINGQLEGDPKFKWLEQGRSEGDAEKLLEEGKNANCLTLSKGEIQKFRVTCGSPIVDYRHQLFDYMAKTNNEKLSVVLGVGSGGKASVATWINNVVEANICSPAKNLADCNSEKARAQIHKAFNAKFKTNYSSKNPLVVIGVPHPGGASPRNGGSGALHNIIRGFTGAATTVAKEMEKNSSWLESDSQESRSRLDMISDLKKEYRYGNAPIPFRDFAFGTNWRMGDRGTTSNRRGSHAIQVFSSQGKYNNDGHKLKYYSVSDDLSGLNTDNMERPVPGMKEMDLAYEPPRYYSNDKEHSKQYDYGPCGEDKDGNPEYSCDLSIALQSWSKFDELKDKEGTKIDAPYSDASFGYGSIYRGDLKDSKVLIFSDQLSQDAFFSGRALTGGPGQRVQKFIEVARIDGNYGILRTLPVDTLDYVSGSTKVNEDMVLQKDVSLQRNKILDMIIDNKDVVVVIGDSASKAWDEYAKNNRLAVFLRKIDPPTDSNIEAWEKLADEVSKKITGKSALSGYAKNGSPIAKAIPRRDLPYSTRWWMGTSGSRVVRGSCTSGCDDKEGDYYKAFAPNWVNKLKPRKTSKDRELISEYLKNAPDSGRSDDPALALLNEIRDVIEVTIAGNLVNAAFDKESGLLVTSSQSDWESFRFWNQDSWSDPTLGASESYNYITLEDITVQLDEGRSDDVSLEQALEELTEDLLDTVVPALIAVVDELGEVFIVEDYPEEEVAEAP